jgi:hypothetical protein
MRLRYQRQDDGYPRTGCRPLVGAQIMFCDLAGGVVGRCFQEAYPLGTSGQPRTERLWILIEECPSSTPL